MAAIDELLDRARAKLRRVHPEEAARATARGALLIDIRPSEQRNQDGSIPGALVISRNVLEWRLDPTSEWHIPEITNHDQQLIVICNEGYQSSLVAATLQDLGLTNATDLDGGFQAWRNSGLPVD